MKTNEKEPKICDNCGRRFRSLDALHIHWIVATCVGKRESDLVEAWKRDREREATRRELAPE